MDFAWPGRRLALEYDGLWHAEPGQFARDRQRLNRLSAAGWRVVFVTAADLVRPVELVARLRAAGEARLLPLGGDDGVVHGPPRQPGPGDDGADGVLAAGSCGLLDGNGRGELGR